MLRDELVSAIIDYRWLLDRHYPQRSSIHIVGNRYRLSGPERSMLYRGVSDSVSANKRFRKIIPDLRSGLVAIDCYNILFTLANYLLGKPVYISDDGILRDAGEGRGRINNKKIFDQALNLMKSFISDRPEKEYFILLDAPVSNSGKLAVELTGFLNESGIKGIAETLGSPDYVLQNLNNAVICSSDSVILNRTLCPVYDLSRQILIKAFEADFVSIFDIFKTNF